MASGDVRVVQRAHDLDRTHAADITIEIPAVQYGVNMRAEKERGKPFRAGTMAKDISSGINANLKPGLTHELHHIVARGHVDLREAESRDPAVRVVTIRAQRLESPL